MATDIKTAMEVHMQRQQQIDDFARIKATVSSIQGDLVTSTSTINSRTHTLETRVETLETQINELMKFYKLMGFKKGELDGDNSIPGSTSSTG